MTLCEQSTFEIIYNFFYKLIVKILCCTFGVQEGQTLFYNKCRAQKQYIAVYRNTIIQRNKGYSKEKSVLQTPTRQLCTSRPALNYIDSTAFRLRKPRSKDERCFLHRLIQNLPLASLYFSWTTLLPDNSRPD